MFYLTVEARTPTGPILDMEGIANQLLPCYVNMYLWLIHHDDALRYVYRN